MGNKHIAVKLRFQRQFFGLGIIGEFGRVHFIVAWFDLTLEYGY